MKNNKIGISIPWFTKSNATNIYNQDFYRFIIKNIFLQQNIFISDIYIQEYPKAINFKFNLFIIKKTQYNIIKYLIEFIHLILILYTKKNIFITFKTAPNLYNNIDVLIEWLNLKIQHKPSNLKKTIKQVNKQYDSITK